MDLSALYNLSYGLFIITSTDGEKFNGQTANTVFQITSEPPTIAISINKKNLTHEFIEKTKKFAVSVLSISAPLSLIGRFGFRSGKDIDKLEGIECIDGKLGIPCVKESAVAVIEAKVIGELDAGTHTLFLGEVVNTKKLTNDEPMTYAYYHAVKSGKEPPTAPTYRKEKPKEVKMEKYVCTVCGFIYDPEKGDPDGGIAPGTKFEDIPEDWVCPVCGVSKDQFKKMED